MIRSRTHSKKMPMTAACAVLVPCMIMGSAASAASVPADGTVAAKGTATCKVVESGMGRVERNQYVAVGAVIQNTSKKRTATTVRVTIAYKNAKGKVLSYPTEYWMPDIAPKSKVMFGHTTDFQESEVNAATKVSVSATCASSKRKAVKPLTSKGRPASDSYYGDYIKGLFRNTSDHTFPAFATSFYVVRDTQGDIVGGGESQIAADLAPGARAEWTGGLGFPRIRSGSATLFPTSKTG